MTKSNDAFCFKNNDNQELSTKKIEVKDSETSIWRFFSQVFLIKIKNNSSFNANKQFLVSISSFLGWFEFLYDLEDENLIVSKLPI